MKVLFVLLISSIALEFTYGEPAEREVSDWVAVKLKEDTIHSLFLDIRPQILAVLTSKNLPNNPKIVSLLDRMEKLIAGGFTGLHRDISSKQLKVRTWHLVSPFLSFIVGKTAVDIKKVTTEMEDTGHGITNEVNNIFKTFFGKYKTFSDEMVTLLSA